MVIFMKLQIKLPDRHVREINGDVDRDQERQTKFLRSTRSICVYSQDVPFNSKEIYTVEFIVNDEVKHSGIYCIDLLGSQRGYVIVGDKRILEKCDEQPAELRILEADARTKSEWLKSNLDPERRALGTILEEDLSKSDALRSELTELANEAKHNFTLAQKEREKIRSARNWIWGMSGAAFVGGSLLDFGLLEEKFGFSITPVIVATLSAITLAALVITGLKLAFKEL